MRLDDADIRAENFIASNLDLWVQEFFVLPLKDAMRKAGHPSYVIEAVKYKRTGRLDFEIVWDLFTEDDAPLGIFLEKGWKPHDIESKWPDGPLLTWVDKLSGRRRFAKKVRNPGFLGYGFFDITAEIQTPKFMQESGSQLENHLKDVSIA